MVGRPGPVSKYVKNIFTFVIRFNRDDFSNKMHYAICWSRFFAHLFIAVNLHFNLICVDNIIRINITRSMV